MLHNRLCLDIFFYNGREVIGAYTSFYFLARWMFFIPSVKSFLLHRLIRRNNTGFICCFHKFIYLDLVFLIIISFVLILHLYLVTDGKTGFEEEEICYPDHRLLLVGGIDKLGVGGVRHCHFSFHLALIFSTCR